MDKRKILAVTSRLDDFELIRKALDDNYEVLHAKQAVLAIAVIGSLRPWAVIVDVKQQGMDGAGLCDILRTKLGSSTCLYILYQEDKVDQSPRANKPTEEDGNVDLMTRGDGPPMGLIAEWLREQSKPKRPGMQNTNERPTATTTAAPRSQPTPEGSARRGGAPAEAPAEPPRAQRFKTASGKPTEAARPQAERIAPRSRPGQAVTSVRGRGPIVERAADAPSTLPPQSRPTNPAPPPNTPEQEVTWGDLMQTDIDKGELKKLIAEEARERVARGEDPNTMSWTEILRRPVNRKTIQALMTKDILGSSDEEYEEEEEEQADPKSLSWGQLLNRPISKNTLKALLTKRLGSKESVKS
jgi:CheY-like chemotaxis protein